MKTKKIIFCILTLIVAIVLSSCASSPEEQPTQNEVEEVAVTTQEEKVEIIDSTELTVEEIEPRPDISTSTNISFAFDRPRLTKENQVLIINNLQPLLPIDAQTLVEYYFEEAELEGINTDLAIAQMIYNTNELKYGGLFAINNPGGLGTANNSTVRQEFNTLQLGVRAHIQHLKGYASDSELQTDVVDSRRNVLIEEDFLGNVYTLGELFFTWYDYEGIAEKIVDVLNRQYNAVL